MEFAFGVAESGREGKLDYLCRFNAHTSRFHERFQRTVSRPFSKPKNPRFANRFVWMCPLCADILGVTRQSPREGEDLWRHFEQEKLWPRKPWQNPPICSEKVRNDPSIPLWNAIRLSSFVGNQKKGGLGGRTTKVQAGASAVSSIFKMGWCGGVRRKSSLDFQSQNHFDDNFFNPNVQRPRRLVCFTRQRKN